MSMRTKVMKPDSVSVFDVIVAPMITEKATVASGDRQYTFKVANTATKPNIKVAVEKLFKVKVEAIQTMMVKGKVKRFRGRKGKRNDFKKAIVRVAEGQTIDVTAGL